MTPALLTVATPLPWNVHLRRPAASLPFPFQSGLKRIYARARQGLYEGLRRLPLPAGSVALVPAYHHGSEIEAYVRAGLRLRYYDAGPALEPDATEVENQFDSSVGVLHVIHYLGFAQESARWRAWCDARGVRLVEDAAQGWLGSVEGRPLGTWGELSLFSLYKTVGVPDGGVAVLQGDVMRPSGRHHLGIRGIASKHGYWFASRSSSAAALWRRVRQVSPYVAEKDFTLGDPDRGATVPMSHLLPRLLSSPVATTRARHYRRLLSDLRAWVPSFFRRDPEGLSPFAFPVFVDDKERAASILMRHGIRAVNLWSVPHPSLRASDFPRAALLRSGVLLLPVHQELTPGDLDRIAAVARTALGTPPAALGSSLCGGAHSH